MPRPTQFPDFATTDVVDGTSGQNNVAAPSGPKILQGWDYREKPPRQWLNWLHRFTGLWVRWFDELLESRTADATPDSLMLRDANGRAKVADPDVDGDIANKGYVDESIAGNVAPDPLATDDLASHLTPAQVPTIARAYNGRVMVKCDTTAIGTITGNYNTYGSGLCVLSSLSEALNNRKGDLIYVSFSGAAPDSWCLSTSTGLSLTVFSGGIPYGATESGTFTIYTVTNDLSGAGLVDSLPIGPEKIFSNPAGTEIYFSRDNSSSEFRPDIFQGYGRDGSALLFVEPIYVLTETPSGSGLVKDRVIARITAATTGALSDATFLYVTALGDDIDLAA